MAQLEFPPPAKWWCELKDLNFSQSLKEYEAVFRKTFERRGRHTPFCWTHTLAVGTSEYVPYGYYCGQACLVERAWRPWGDFRVACFWCGEKTIENIYYRIVPTSFVLIPSMCHLRRVVLSLAERLKLEVVDGKACSDAKQLRLRAEKTGCI